MYLLARRSLSVAAMFVLTACASDAFSSVKESVVSGARPQPTFTAGGVEFGTSSEGEALPLESAQATITEAVSFGNLNCNGFERTCSGGGSAQQYGLWSTAEMKINATLDYGTDGDEIASMESPPLAGAGYCTTSQTHADGTFSHSVCVERYLSKSMTLGSFNVTKCNVRVKANTYHSAWFNKFLRFSYQPGLPPFEVVLGKIGETTDGTIATPVTSNFCSQGGSYTVYQGGGSAYEGCAQEDVIEVWLVSWWPWSAQKIGWFCMEPEQ
jgi:hypothetical protein